MHLLIAFFFIQLLIKKKVVEFLSTIVLFFLIDIPCDSQCATSSCVGDSQCACVDTLLQFVRDFSKLPSRTFFMSGSAIK